MDWNVSLSFSVAGDSAADCSVGAFADGFVLCFEPECEKGIVGGTDSLSGVKWEQMLELRAKVLQAEQECLDGAKTLSVSQARKRLSERVNDI